MLVLSHQTFFTSRFPTQTSESLSSDSPPQISLNSDQLQPKIPSHLGLVQNLRLTETGQKGDSLRVLEMPGDDRVRDTGCCIKAASAKLKLYQTFIFSVPILFTFVLLLFFYLFYLRCRRVDGLLSRIRSAVQEIHTDHIDIPNVELGLKKELREMLPVIVYKESFFIKDSQCSVCLGDYQAEDRLQQIPSCGHSFHMECIDHWLAKSSTCPLCRLSLRRSSKSPNELDAGQRTSTTEENGAYQPQGLA